MQAYLQGQELFTQDLYAGADPAHRVSVRLVTTRAWPALFARNMFIRPAATSWTASSPTTSSCTRRSSRPTRRSTACAAPPSIALSFEQKLIVIAGTEYAGEIKKSIFTVMNWLLPPQGVLPMHCSANIGAGGDVALFFGLSGTGKTTLSSDPARPLIGDDEHGWGPDGVFNVEGGCYAKVINLRRRPSRRSGPPPTASARCWRTWWPTTHGRLDLADKRYTENTRACYPVEFIPNAVPTGRGGQPKNVVMLTCRRVRRAAADRPADPGAGDVPLPVRLHRQRRRHREGRWARSRRPPSPPASARPSCRAGRRSTAGCWPS